MSRVLNYPGSKWGLADWIVSLMPQHRSYLEPFFGSGAVFFSKEPSPIETVNDLDGDVVNLFRVIREQPEDLAAAVALTPFSRQEYDAAWELLRHEHRHPDSVEQARRFLIRCWQCQGCNLRRKAGWKRDVAGREAAYTLRSWNRLPDWILAAARRLKDAQIEQQPALELIRQFRRPEVLIYADPPYLLSRRAERQYQQELDEAGHEELLKALMQHPGPVLLSGYDSDLYRDLLPRSWDCLRKPAVANGGGRRTEFLWVNFEIQLKLDI